MFPRQYKRLRSHHIHSKRLLNIHFGKNVLSGVLIYWVKVKKKMSFMDQTLLTLMAYVTYKTASWLQINIYTIKSNMSHICDQQWFPKFGQRPSCVYTRCHTGPEALPPQRLWKLQFHVKPGSRKLHFNFSFLLVLVFIRVGVSMTNGFHNNQL